LTDYIYGDYVKTLSTRFVRNLDTILTEHNFEYGPEFEVAICETLRSALPDRFGIARGYVVDSDNTRAGDDIIVYDRSRFPTLALRDRDDYGRKEFIPIEAVYCYIEAKYTLNLQGEDPQSLAHAATQASAVKELCATRESMHFEDILPEVRLRGGGLRVSGPEGYPSIKNPTFSAIFARRVRRRKGGEILNDPSEIDETIRNLQIAAPPEPPDLIVLGDSNVIVPILPSTGTEGNRLRSPFFITGHSSHNVSVVDGVAFGVALASMMEALDWIQLGRMPWRKILSDGLRISPAQDG
jgi:hypothetical protein